MKKLPYKRDRKKVRKKRVQKRATPGTCIEDRPKQIDKREEVGHWEMDTVHGPQGKSKKVVLVLTERCSRIEILEFLNGSSSREVVKALDRIERRIGEKTFRRIFKTITCDNGPEFMDSEGIEKSRRNIRKTRTKLYYCHPYSSWERGSNENQNRLLRRWISKGQNFDNMLKTELKRIEAWMNTYPRKIFSGKTAIEIYENAFQGYFWRGNM